MISMGFEGVDIFYNTNICLGLLLLLALCLFCVFLKSFQEAIESSLCCHNRYIGKLVITQSIIRNGFFEPGSGVPLRFGGMMVDDVGSAESRSVVLLCAY